LLRSFDDVSDSFIAAGVDMLFNEVAIQIG
jgi:hypothetical protein